MKSLLLPLLIIPALAPASESPSPLSEPSPTVIVHLFSRHSSPGYNNQNFGLGLRTMSGLTFGGYCNSESRSPKFPLSPSCSPSFYLGKSWEFPLSPSLSFGLFAGGVSGYSRAPILPIVLPSIRFHSLRVLLAPKVGDGAGVVSVAVEF